MAADAEGLLGDEAACGARRRLVDLLDRYEQQPFRFPYVLVEDALTGKHLYMKSHSS